MNTKSSTSCAHTALMTVAASACLLGSYGAMANDVTVAWFPVSITSGSGRIQIDAKLIGFTASDSIKFGWAGGGQYPQIFSLYPSNPGVPQGTALYFNANDGRGGAGVATGAGDATTARSAATGPFTTTFTYGDILGKYAKPGQTLQGSVDDWHTYEVVWNKAGLTSVDPRAYFAVYIDGVLDSGYFKDTYGGDFLSGDYMLAIGGPSWQGTETRDVAFDNLRVWNTFDMQVGSLFVENGFEDVSLVSTVGPDGSYVEGPFIAGRTGNALKTPEPSAYCLLSALALAGFAGVRRARQG